MALPFLPNQLSSSPQAISSSPEKSTGLSTKDMASSSPETVQEPPKRLNELMKSGKMVKIYVGRDKADFWILHEEVICYYSEFFKKAFKGPFAEGTTKEMTLEDDDPAVFGRFVDWIYGWNLGPCEGPHDSGDRAHLVEWCSLHVFADKFGNKFLADESLRQYMECSRMGECAKLCPSTEIICIIWQNTAPDSLFAIWLVKETYRKSKTILWLANPKVTSSAVYQDAQSIVWQVSGVTKELIVQRRRNERGISSQEIQPSIFSWVLRENSGHFPEGLLCQSSSWFKAAFQSIFKEGREKSMELPENDLKVFDKIGAQNFANGVNCECCNIWDLDGVFTPKNVCFTVGKFFKKRHPSEIFTNFGPFLACNKAFSIDFAQEVEDHIMLSKWSEYKMYYCRIHSIQTKTEMNLLSGVAPGGSDASGNDTGWVNMKSDNVGNFCGEWVIDGGQQR
ncbi:hypothetical protein G7Y89_g12700 [Cudoniella acicularis]|uniref:BTB domain-containing protein n=1 Tax=Cudoniella acicularis TaxID=354080 RepID=A0A8H4RAX4_9HELO|nr:hypothetical protein G7Y89_g12700 [Cudoniella acicularis]